MREFQVLPTDPSWLAMSNDQIEWMLRNMSRDTEEANRRKSGKELEDEFQDYDSSWYDQAHDEWTPLREGDDEQAIANQVASMTSPEDMAKLKARWEASQEVDEIQAKGGTTIEEDTINELIQNNLIKAIEEAKRIEKHGGNKWGEKTPIEIEEEKANQQFQTQLKQESIQDAINLFEGDEIELPSQDDDFEI